MDAKHIDFYPFHQPNHIDGMIIGNDLDSLLSACLLHDRFGWDVIGVYDYSNLWYSNSYGVTIEKINNGNYVAVDLDIYNSKIYSIGHHILNENINNLIPNHSRSLNPNLQRGISGRDFYRKYPLGTIHLLLWMLGESDLSEESAAICWLADSSFINGQSHRFRRNVQEWNINYFNGLYSDIINEIDTIVFEQKVRRIISNYFDDIVICKSRGQVNSKYLGITGFQCQWTNPNMQNISIQNLLDRISLVTNWSRPKFPSKLSFKTGNRRKIMISEVREKYGSLDNFLEQEKVFSYVLPFKDSINYTVDI